MMTIQRLLPWSSTRYLRVVFGLSLIASFIPFANATECIKTNIAQVLTYEQAITTLRKAKFIKGESGKRNYNPDTLDNWSANDVGLLLEGVATRNDRSAVFWLKLAGSTLEKPGQASCFIRHWMLPDQKALVKDMQYLSKLVKKAPQRKSLVIAMTNIAREMDGEAVLAYFQAEQAVYFTSSMQGIGYSPANARHNKKKMQHLPNSLMRIMAKRLEESDVVLRATIYQVEHMGYEIEN